jgi:hypothetical protein
MVLLLEWASLQGPHAIRAPSHSLLPRAMCWHVQHWTFFNLPLTYFSGFGSSNGRTCVKMPTQLHLLKRNSKNATQNETFLGYELTIGFIAKKVVFSSHFWWTVIALGTPHESGENSLCRDSLESMEFA